MNTPERNGINDASRYDKDRYIDPEILKNVKGGAAPAAARTEITTAAVSV